MKLHEVLESGKKFRRNKWYFYDHLKDYYHQKTNGVIEDSIGFRFDDYHIDDVLADDWEIIEQKIELTESQIREAFEHVITPNSTIGQRDYVINTVLKELGFDNE